MMIAVVLCYNDSCSSVVMMAVVLCYNDGCCSVIMMVVVLRWSCVNISVTFLLLHSVFIQQDEILVRNREKMCYVMPVPVHSMGITYM